MIYLEWPFGHWSLYTFTLVLWDIEEGINYSMRSLHKPIDLKIYFKPLGCPTWWSYPAGITLFEGTSIKKPILEIEIKRERYRYLR